MRCSSGEFDALVRRGVHRPGPRAAVAQLIGRELSGFPGMPYRLEPRWNDVLSALAGGSVFGFAAIGADTRVLVAVARELAARVQVRGDSVTADLIRPDAPWPALTGVLPAAEPAAGSEVTVPTAILAEARESPEIARELRRREVPDDDARDLEALLTRADGFTARIEVALCEGDEPLRRVGSTIEVHHSKTGRVAVIPEAPDDTYTMVAPADAFVIGRALQHHLDTLWNSTEAS
ncbi:ESX secretion-associated protein EspG [Saccharopolyspora taberi]|uniref:ESX secretion-associated protein EspG n=1 Tax=Saccharopolyspora taberi TaxID=60895 RepID=A0ABN3VFZ1_9PSEU